MAEFIRVAVSLTPVFLFLTALIFIDTYKLVKLRSVMLTIIVGGGDSHSLYDPE